MTAVQAKVHGRNIGAAVASQRDPAAVSQTSPQSAQFSSLTSTQAPSQHSSWPSPEAPGHGPAPAPLKHLGLVPHMHVPAVHESVNRGSHVVPQAPQFSTSVVTSTHERMPVESGQQADPAAHGPPVSPQTHSPSVQELASRGSQTLPQAPQLSRSEPTVLQPVSQQSWPVRQRSAEPLHVQCVRGVVPSVTQPVAIGGSSLRQSLPQEPQLAASVVVSVQVSPQHRSGSVHGGEQAETMQAPASQIWPDSQELPQVPQLARSVRMSTQVTPQHIVPPVQPPGHASPAQTPAVHATPDGHSRSHEPQFMRSICRLAQAAPQHTSPRPQVLPPQEQKPERHWPPVQAVPHDLQFSSSVSRSTQRLSPQTIGSATSQPPSGSEQRTTAAEIPAAANPSRKA
jgi:hypothetical protein